MRTARGGQEDPVHGWLVAQSADVSIARLEQSHAQTRHRSSYRPHLFVHDHIQNEGLVCEVSTVGMAVSDGLLSFELPRGKSGASSGWGPN